MRYTSMLAPNGFFRSNFLDEVDQLFNDVWNTALPLPSGSTIMNSLNYETSESDEAYFLSFDLPGLKKEDIKIEVQGNNLTVSGERKKEYHEGRRATGFQKRSYGYFNRSFTLPTSVDAKKIEANYQDGVLEIALPKAEMAKPRKIEIQSSGELKKFPQKVS